MATTRFAPEPKFERPADQDFNVGPPLSSALIGGLLGLFGGCAVAGTEDALRAWTGIAPGPAFDDGFVWTMVIGVIFGIAAGASGLRGARWCAPFVGLVGGWLAGGSVAHWLAADGLIPHPAVIAGLITGGAGGTAAGHLISSPKVLLGGATGVLIAIVFVDLAHLHLLAGPSTPQSVLIDVLALGLGATVGVAVGVLAGTALSLHVALCWASVATVGVSLAAFAGGVRPVPVASGDAHPPLVIVIVDGLRADHAGFAGADESSTPELDRALRGALTFTDASTTAPWPLPAIASMLTGARPFQHGAVGPGLPVRAEIATIAELLRARGTVCAAVVSGDGLRPGYGLDRGFAVYDHAAGPTAVRAMIDPLVTMWLTPFPWPDADDADVLTDRALAFVTAQTRPQWCLVVVYDDPAQPGAPSLYEPRVRTVDSAAARLLAALPANAKVIVAGAHGVELDEARQGANWHPDGVGYGHSMYQEVMHVPLAILGDRRSGRVNRPVSLIDVLPTALALVESPVPGNLAGASLLEGGPDRPVIGEAMRWGPDARLIRRGPMKMIAWEGNSRLWDLSTDPREITTLTGVSGRDLETYKALTSELPPWHPVEPPVAWPAVVRDLAIRVGRRPSPLRATIAPAPAPIP